MLVARPMTVFLCALPDRRARWSFNEMLFMCWTRETGVIPAALAGLLLGMKAPGAQMIASVTFIAILMTILIQAPTTKWLGKRLGLLEENRRFSMAANVPLQQSEDDGQAARLHLRGRGDRAEPADLHRRAARPRYGQQAGRRAGRFPAQAFKRCRISSSRWTAPARRSRTW